MVLDFPNKRLQWERDIVPPSHPNVCETSATCCKIEAHGVMHKEIIKGFFEKTIVELEDEQEFPK